MGKHECGEPNALHGDSEDPAPGAARCCLRPGHTEATHVAWTDTTHMIVWVQPGRVWDAARALLADGDT